jgi:hypothetical protein
MSLLLLSGMSMGASTVRRLSGSAWNWLSVVALPSCGLTVFDTLKLEVRLEMKVVLPRPDSPVLGEGGRGGEGREREGKGRGGKGEGGEGGREGREGKYSGGRRRWGEG